MFKHFLICNIFFIALCGSKLIPPVYNATKASVPVLFTQLEKNDKITHKVLSEGGSISHISAVTLPSKDLTLVNLETIANVTKETSVVPRKGVNYEESIKSHEDEESASGIPIEKIANKTNIASTIPKNIAVLNETNIPNDVQKVKDAIPHKPLLLSSEALARMDKLNNITIDESSSSIKVQAVKARSHPEMILPIVITILVVPMFAVVAFMALKRGQEAWKNRHYKRMDFLLDGMYND